MKQLLGVFGFLLLISSVLAQSPQRFKSTVWIKSGTDPNWDGFLIGTLYYDWNFVVQGDGGSATGAWTTQYNFQGAPAGIVETIRGEYLNGLKKTVRYLKCTSKCDAELRGTLPRLWAHSSSSASPDTTNWSQNNGDTISYTPPGTSSALTCTAFNRVVGSTPLGANDVRKLYVAINNARRPCRAILESGREWDFETYESFSDNTVFNVPSSWGCPVPTCPTVVDMVIVLDESGSISNADFATMKNNFAVPLVEAYTFADFTTNPPKDGAIMSLVWFSGRDTSGANQCMASVLRDSGRVYELRPDNNKAAMVNAIKNHAQDDGFTCGGGGIQVANAQFRQLYTNILPTRTTSTKVVIFVTDGASNKYCSEVQNQQTYLKCDGWTRSRCPYGSGSSNDIWCSRFHPTRWPQDQPPNYCLTQQCTYTEYVTDRSRNELNILIVAIGVGGDLIQNEIHKMASNRVGLILPSYTALANYLNQLITQTCVDLNIPQCQCRGWCLCSGECVCPSCDDRNFCTDDSCGANLGCRWLDHSCEDGDFCTDNTCSVAQQQCLTSNVNCDDGQFCTIDSCQSSSGCIHETNPCFDGDACTTDTCDETNDVCVNTPVGGTCLCDTVTCPQSFCKINVCDNSNGECVESDKVCDDGNACTVDTCDISNGNCVYTLITCNDNDVCTTDTCNPQVGCVFTNVTVEDPSHWDDFNKCTLDLCHPALGAQHPLVNCSETLSSPPCFEAKCLVPQIGCAQYRVNCLLPGQDPDCYLSACNGQDYVEFIYGPDGNITGNITTPGDGICRPTKIEGTCEENEDNTVAIAAGIAAGVLAAIIIAIIICAICGAVSGYGAWKLINKHRGNIDTLNNNPLYEGKDETNNPLYSDE